MLIPVNVALPGPSCTPRRKLPPQLVQFGTDELLLIELQGALEVEGDRDSQLVGKLRVDPTTTKPTLLIGHHLLEGKLVNLSKPLAVLKRHDDAQTTPEDAMPLDPDGPPRAPSGAVKSWDVIAVVKRKMVFSKRPMPIVGKLAGSSGAPTSRISSKP
ncbi:Ctf8-domain-containing protein [Trametes punicea]|nr:Ctf8-domain-containing protein [Trametes punicea]